VIDSEYMARLRSPWCWQDYIEILAERPTELFVVYESDPELIQYGYCAVGVGNFYLGMIGDEDGETIYYY
jgi:hypothetical protein